MYSPLMKNLAATITTGLRQEKSRPSFHIYGHQPEFALKIQAIYTQHQLLPTNQRNGQNTLHKFRRLVRMTKDVWIVLLPRGLRHLVFGLSMQPRTHHTTRRQAFTPVFLKTLSTFPESQTAKAICIWSMPICMSRRARLIHPPS